MPIPKVLDQLKKFHVTYKQKKFLKISLIQNKTSMTKTFFLEFISNEINGLPKTKNDEEEEEEEEETFEQDTESAKRNNSNKQESLINNQKTFKLDLKSAENGNFNKQDPTNSIDIIKNNLC
ncbi:hypothetical protein C2G38_2184605 [Gigaspora rosea]|uniref:Uncharacterized protein n=1 Tax=Gigaspora rosea TaxID=44941 RepID=A0A397V939_9GLOM|nr:hypothetical protein C2G38_2184605 [Gigaspora rosea]